MAPGKRSRRRNASDDGFTLVEALVSLFLIAIVMGGIATEVISALHSSTLGRQVNQAADLLMAQSEQVQDMPYASVAMDPADLSGDARITSGQAKLGAVTEPVYAVTGGAISPHIKTVVRQKTSYSVAQYVTTPGGACACHRVTTFVTWKAFGHSHTRSTSTMVSDVQRGNISQFTWAATKASTVASVSRGSSLVLPVTLINAAAPDSWTLSLNAQTTPAAASWTRAWYVDSNGDGAWQPTIETTQLAANGSGTVTTGVLRSGVAMRYLAVFNVPTTAATGTVTVALTATPTNSTGTAQTVVFTVTVN